MYQYFSLLTYARLTYSHMCIHEDIIYCIYFISFGHTCNDRNSVYFYKSLPTIRRATPIATCNDTSPLPPPLLMCPCKICRRSFREQSNAGRTNLLTLLTGY
ncbi:hypothetical protein PUN28_008123 [Cardiocondyla obscurior]|uniref:Uncharacterized protein n=1 Tax=Cardiocondyla obscurior TaxID=286306 RepID=A0AAW2FXT0_9HYME